LNDNNKKYQIGRLAFMALLLLMNRTIRFHELGYFKWLAYHNPISFHRSKLSMIYCFLFFIAMKGKYWLSFFSEVKGEERLNLSAVFEKHRILFRLEYFSFRLYLVKAICFSYFSNFYNIEAISFSKTKYYSEF
jgi:hypothetical protein